MSITHLIDKTPDELQRRVLTATKCGRFVHIIHCTKHRVATTCKQCLELDKPKKRKK